MKKAFLAGILISAFSSSVWADQKVEAKTTSSSSSSSMTLGYQYLGDENSIWTTNVQYTSTRSKILDSNGQIETTRDLQWINDWDWETGWFVELGVGGSNTEVNKIHTANTDFSLGRTHEDLNNFNWSLTFGRNNIQQADARTKGGKRLDILQSKFGLQAGIDIVDWLSVSIFSDRYTYDKDVDQALTLLQNSAAVRLYGTAFSDQLSTLIEKESGVSFIVRFDDSWRLTLTGTKSVDAPAPHAEGTGISSKLYHKFNSEWDGSVTLGSNHYDATSTTPSTSYSYVGLGAGYTW